MERLRALISQMGGMAEHAIGEAMRCLVQRDTDGAERVIREDKKLDALEVETERRAVQLIALRAPMAGDLRDVVAALKISGVVERIGDYAKNIAKRIPLLENVGKVEPLSLLPEMARIATGMVHDVLDAFVARDAEAAVRVCERDDAVDDFYDSIFRALLTHMMENPHNIGQAAHLLFVAKNLERGGDRPAHDRPARQIAEADVMANKRLLLVEDDRALADLITFHFERAGFDVTRTGDGEEALILADEMKPDIVLLDWMIEGISGIEVCRRLRRREATGNVPIVMLTARGEEGDRIRGLETGADDYVTKPFSPRELMARVGAVLRRVRPALAGEQLAYADIEMDVAAHRVRRNGEQVPLGPTEFRLLRHFLEHPGHVFSRERLLDAVWSHDPDIDARTVDVHVRRLRQALNQGSKPDLIRTVRSAGYALDSQR
jgi:two-component system phosphate regulon response regulator PhoB